MARNIETSLILAVAAMEKHAAKVGSVIDKCMAVDTPQVCTFYMHHKLEQIKDLVTKLEQVAFRCKEVLQNAQISPTNVNDPVTDDVVDPLVPVEPSSNTDTDEGHSLEDYKPLWAVLKDMGIDYDSDQSRGC